MQLNYLTYFNAVHCGCFCRSYRIQRIADSQLERLFRQAEFFYLAVQLTENAIATNSLTVANHKMSLGSYLWLLIVVGYANAVSSSRRWSELHVPVGRSTFIQPHDVIVERRANGTSCKVKTITDDVANVLKVGRVEPPVITPIIHLI
jgi:hypothetical protein